MIPFGDTEEVHMQTPPPSTFLHLCPKTACQLICLNCSGINLIFIQVQICLLTYKHFYFFSFFFKFPSLDNSLTFPPSNLWWNTERGQQHALRWSFINQSAVWSPSSISHHRRGSVQKVAQAMSQGSAIYLKLYVPCEGACMVFLLTSECTIVRWFMNMYFHESRMLLCIHSLERKHGSFVMQLCEHRDTCELTVVGVYYIGLSVSYCSQEGIWHITGCHWACFINLNFLKSLNLPLSLLYPL